MVSKPPDKYSSVGVTNVSVSMFSNMPLWTFSREVYVEWNCLLAGWKTLDSWLQFKWTFKRV